MIKEFNLRCHTNVQVVPVSHNAAEVIELESVRPVYVCITLNTNDVEWVVYLNYYLYSQQEQMHNSKEV